MAKVLVQDWLSQTYQDRSPNSSSRRLVNGYLQGTEGEGKFPVEVIGTPGTEVFTRVEDFPFSIASIQGDGSFPNTVVVNASAGHGLSVGQLVNITGTTNYNQPSVVVASTPTASQFTYVTYENTESVANTSGQVEPTGESPITDVPVDASCRGLYTTSTGRVFTAFYNYLFELYEDGAWVIRHDIGVGSTTVSMTDDGFHLVFVDGTKMWALELATNTVTEITTLDFAKPTKVVFSIGRIVCINGDVDNNNANKFYFSDLYAATSWPVFNYASAESSADIITSVEVREGELWFFGPRSYEVWRPADNPDLPFVKVGGSSTEIGCGAPDSTSNIAGQVFWLGSSTAGQNMVFMSQGYGAQRISNHAIEYALGQVTLGTTDAIGFTYQQEGHTFYVLTLIQGNRTFVYDTNTGKWHERSSRDAAINKENYWEVLYATFAFGKVLCGGLSNARVMTLNLDRFVEWDGRPIVRLLRGPITFNELSQLFHYRLDIDMETGVGRQAGEPYNSGVQSGLAEEPYVMLRHSSDGGHTWSSQRTARVGRVGEYNNRVVFHRLGRSRQRVYELSMSSPVKWHLLGARLSVKPGGQP